MPDATYDTSSDPPGVTDPIDLVITFEYYGNSLPRKFNYCAHERDRDLPSYQSTTREDVTILATRMIQAHRINNLLDTKVKAIAWQAFNKRWGIDTTRTHRKHYRPRE